MAESYYATGRRKTSSARVYLSNGSGEITINGDLLCFLYDFDRDGLPVCWATFRDGDNLFVASAPPGSVEIQKVTSITEDGLACPIKPGV